MTSHNSLCSTHRSNPLVLIVSFAVLWSIPAWSQPPAARRPAPASRANVPTQAVPLLLKALRVNPNDVAGGNRADGVVELSQAPDANGVTVTLESSNPQLAGVPPQITITHGTTSAETGPMFMATFPIDTQAVNQDTTVTIKAHVGVQTLQANLRIRRPGLKEAHFWSPTICDGDNKGTVHYILTGPAPSGLRVSAHSNVIVGGGRDADENVPVGKSEGTLQIGLALCRADKPGGQCSITGSARVEGATSASFFGSCVRPPG